MKKSLLICLGICGLAAAAFGHDTYDPFTYPAGSLLIGQSPRADFTWVPAGPGGPAQAVVEPGQVQTKCMEFAATNRIVIHAGAGPSALLPFSTPTVPDDNYAAVSNGTYYFSFALQVSDLGALTNVGSVIAGLTPQETASITTPTAIFTRVWVRPSGAGYQVGLTKASPLPMDVVWGSDIFSANETILIVGLYRFQIGVGNDSSELWINPDPTTFCSSSPPLPTLMDLLAADAPLLAGFVFLQKTAPLLPTTLRADELHLGATWMSVVAPGCDFGDAPEPQYRTLAARNGARHQIIPGIHLGATEPDAECDGQPDSTATGDDTNSSDDETGVTGLGMLFLGHTQSLEVLASTAGILDAWVDWNRDGQWGEPDERIGGAGGITLTPGTNTISLTVPADASTSFSPTFARFRFSTGGGLTPIGVAPDGSVEDLRAFVMDPNIVVSMLPSNAIVDAGDLVSCSITFSNSSPWVATNVMVTTAFNCPIASNSLAATAGNWTPIPGDTNGNVTWQIASVQPSASCSLTFTVTANSTVDTVTNSSFMDWDWWDLQSLIPASISTFDLITVRKLDFGDAPDPGYTTLRASEGARHRIVSGYHLGSTVDAESDGLPNATATGDDTTSTADEDGVAFPSPLTKGAVGYVQVTASTWGYLDAWVDFNRDGKWSHGEKIFPSAFIAPGTSLLDFPVPIRASAGWTVSRFRFSSIGGLGVRGLATDGEVEDHAVEIVALDPPAPLAIQAMSNRVSVRWDAPSAVLQQAAQASGPWFLHPSASNSVEIPRGSAWPEDWEWPSFFRLVQSPHFNRQTFGYDRWPALLREADLIFDGTVTGINYRNSDAPSTNEASYPHTFVTFQVNQVFKGRLVSNSICLRFLGGADTNDMVLTVSDSTLFDVSERSILFVRQNGTRANPLVQGTAGRYRLINNLAYNEGGNEVLMRTNGTMAIGQHRDLTEVIVNQVGNEQIEHVHGPIVGEGQQPPPPEGTIMTAQQLIDYVESQIALIHSQAELQHPVLTPSADITKPFYVRAPQPAAERPGTAP